MPSLVTRKVPLPREKATGMVVQPGPPVRMRPARPSWLTSPATTLPPGAWAPQGTPVTASLVTRKVPLPREKATGMVVQPGPPVSIRSARPWWLTSPDTTLTPGAWAHQGTSVTASLVTRKVPLPREKATGMVAPPGPPVSMRSARPSWLTSPATTLTPGAWAHQGTSVTASLVTRKVPLPREKATGMVAPPGPPVSMRSARPSWLTSPATTLTPGAWAHQGTSVTASLVTRKVPLPREKATGMVAPPGPPVSMRSARPSWLTSPATTLTPGAWAHQGTSVTASLVTRKVPLPREKATGMVAPPGPPVSMRSARPLWLTSPATTLTPGAWAHQGTSVTASLVTRKVPLPRGKAAGMGVPPGPPVSMRSARPSWLTSPATTLTPGAWAHQGTSVTASLVTRKVPLPREKATGMVAPPGPPVSMRSARPLWLTSPATTLTPGAWAHQGTSVTASLVTRKVPLPRGKAAGMGVPPGPPVSMRSARPSWLTSPATTLTPGAWAHQGTSVTASLVTRKVPLPREKATGMGVQPGPPVSMRSARPSWLTSPATTLTPGAWAHQGTSVTASLVTRKVPLPREN